MIIKPMIIKKVARNVELVIFPGSGNAGRAIEQPEARLDGASIADTFRGVGGVIRDSWCGPCFGQGPDALKPGQRAITSFNRNRQNRMGLGGEGYLATDEDFSSGGQFLGVGATLELYGRPGPPLFLATPPRFRGNRVAGVY